MITLFGAGPHFGLPDPSPFVTKAEVLLKMAELPYRHDPNGFGKEPKKKIPFIDDDGVIVPIRPSSACTSKINTASISTPVCLPPKRAAPGRSKSYARSICTGPSSTRAGPTM